MNIGAFTSGRNQNCTLLRIPIPVWFEILTRYIKGSKSNVCKARKGIRMKHFLENNYDKIMNYIYC